MENNDGYFRNGVPYNRCGRGSRILFVFQGLMFENKPMTGFMARQLSASYGFLSADFPFHLAGNAQAYRLVSQRDGHYKNGVSPLRVY